MKPCVIEPGRYPGEPKVPDTGILAVNPADQAGVIQIARDMGLERHHIFHSNLFVSNRLFLAGPAVGAPMATLSLEKLIALGAGSIILYGWCGSLTEVLRPSDLFVPTEALSEEGTSRHYPHAGLLEGNKHLGNIVCKYLKRHDHSFQRGKIWSTDAPYRETREKVAHYGRQGIMAVDMEYSGLCAVALWRRVRLTAVMLVSDRLDRDEWQPAFTSKKFRRRSGEILKLLAGLAAGLNDPDCRRE